MKEPLDIDISERLKIEEALRESKQKAEMLLNVAAEIIISLDSSGSITLLNDSGHRILGYEPPELVGKNWFKTCIPDENRDKLRKYLSMLIEDESKLLVSHENDVVLKGGKRKTILWHNSILRDKDGKGIGLFSSGEDITERKKIEKALHDGEEQKNMILNGLSANVALLDGNLSIVWANKAAADSVNLPVEKLVGSHCYALWGDDAKPCADCPSVRAIQSGTSVHQVVKTKDGKFWDIRGDPIFDDDGKVISIVEIAQDITRLKQQEEALRNGAKRLEGIIEGTHAGTWEWNVQTGETVFNSVWAEIIGYSLEELAPVSIQTWKALVHPEDAAKSHELLRQHFSGNTPFYELECRMKHKDGHWVWVLDRGKVITWAEDGKPLQMFGTHTDIDELKKNSDKIKKLLEEKELVLKEVHHRIKNNMNVISSLLHLQTSVVNDPAAVLALQDAINRIKSMSLLYDKLYQAPSYSELSIHQYLSALVDEVVANFPNSQRITIEKDLKDFNDFMLDVKRLQLLGIIMNELLTNAMKYAFSGKEQGRILVSSTYVENHLTVSVQDDGIGIPALVSFENTTGFGLQLVVTLAQQLNGTIRLERDSGTKFVLEFDA